MIFTNNEQNKIVARVFAPLSGIVEDAATGSACGALGALLASRSNLQTGKIDFEINQGELIGIEGKSGCGKSTLMDLMMGLKKPTKGSLSLKIRDSETNKIFI